MKTALSIFKDRLMKSILKCFLFDYVKDFSN
jgi:hypothetical protein